jgi:hypothetical protein
VKKFPSIAALGIFAPGKARGLLPGSYSEVYLDQSGFIGGAAFPLGAGFANPRLVMRRRDFLQFAGVTTATGFTYGCAVRKTTVATRPPVPAPGAVAVASPAHPPVDLAAPRLSWSA